MDYADIPERVAKYFSQISAAPNHRYRSWEHCYLFFRGGRSRASQELDLAALHLGFYLASWGMYRGSSFLLQRDYTVHKPIINVLCSETFDVLWEREIGDHHADERYVDVVLQAADSVRRSYEPIGNATDTLVTKVLLGIFACLPACDRFFIDGFKRSGHKYSYLNAAFVKRTISFCTSNARYLSQARSSIAAASGVDYPLMKLADMYFWQIGYEAAGEPVQADL